MIKVLVPFKTFSELMVLDLVFSRRLKQISTIFFSLFDVIFYIPVIVFFHELILLFWFLLSQILTHFFPFLGIFGGSCFMIQTEGLKIDHVFRSNSSKTILVLS